MICPECKNIINEDPRFNTIYPCNTPSCCIDNVIINYKTLGPQIDKAQKRYQWKNRNINKGQLN